MSYPNPNILTIPIPTGLDRVISDIQNDLLALSWLTKIFGRAWEFKERTDNKDQRVPKCYSGEGEYIDMRPNDFITAYCFFSAKSEEKWPLYTDASENPKERELAVIFWFNLKVIDENKDYIFTEELKKDVEKILKNNDWVQSINSFVDEKADDVFQGFDLADSQYLMYPNAGFRFNITVGYFEEC